MTLSEVAVSKYRVGLLLLLAVFATGCFAPTSPTSEQVMCISASQCVTFDAKCKGWTGTDASRNFTPNPRDCQQAHVLMIRFQGEEREAKKQADENLRQENMKREALLRQQDADRKIAIATKQLTDDADRRNKEIEQEKIAAEAQAAQEEADHHDPCKVKIKALNDKIQACTTWANNNCKPALESKSGCQNIRKCWASPRDFRGVSHVECETERVCREDWTATCNGQVPSGLFVFSPGSSAGALECQTLVSHQRGFPAGAVGMNDELVKEVCR
jgi:hypothetical protein